MSHLLRFVGYIMSLLDYFVFGVLGKLSCVVGGLFRFHCGIMGDILCLVGEITGFFGCLIF